MLADGPSFGMVREVTETAIDARPLLISWRPVRTVLYIDLSSKYAMDRVFCTKTRQMHPCDVFECSEVRASKVP